MNYCIALSFQSPSHPSAASRAARRCLHALQQGRAWCLVPGGGVVGVDMTLTLTLHARSLLAAARCQGVGGRGVPSHPVATNTDGPLRLDSALRCPQVP